MNLVGLLIALIVIVACAAIFWWFVQASGLPIPRPVLIALYAGVQQVW